MRKRRAALTAVVVTLAVFGSACGDARSRPAASQANRIEISGFLFKPEARVVPSGTTLTWHNADDIAHTVTSGTPAAPTRAFDSGDRLKGRTFSQTFAAPGTFLYFCKNHNGMRGEVTVT